MKIFNNGIKIAGSIIMSAVLSFFLCISMNVICSALFTSEIGYDAYVYENETDSEHIAQYEYLYTDTDGDGTDDGTDIQKAEYENQGYTVTTVKIRSSLTGSGKAVFLISTQVLSFIMIIAFASSSPYKMGFKDSNLVKIGHSKKDMLKGFKIGLIGNIPFFALFVISVVFASGVAPSFYTTWYAFLNAHFYSLITCISGSATSLSQLTLTQYVLLFLLQLAVPLISGIAYILGFKEINLTDKIMYKKEVK